MVLYQNSGTLSQNKDIRPYPFFSPKKDLAVKVEVKGDGHGDIDCYLLKQVVFPQGKGWVVVLRDESNLDQCSFDFTTADNGDLKLWVINHGAHPTTYTVTVSQ